MTMEIRPYAIGIMIRIVARLFVKQVVIVGINLHVGFFKQLGDKYKNNRKIENSNMSKLESIIPSKTGP